MFLFDTVLNRWWSPRFVNEEDLHQKRPFLRIQYLHPTFLAPTLFSPPLPGEKYRHIYAESVSVCSVVDDLPGLLGSTEVVSSQAGRWMLIGWYDLPGVAFLTQIVQS